MTPRKHVTDEYTINRMPLIQKGFYVAIMYADRQGSLPYLHKGFVIDATNYGMYPSPDWYITYRVYEHPEITMYWQQDSMGGYVAECEIPG